MRKVKCINGHFFDLERFSICPLCGAQAEGEVPASRAPAPGEFPVEEPVEQVGQESRDAPMLPVGWLMAVKGPCRGVLFPCKSGRNRIGRFPGMDVDLAMDERVTREAQGILIYEPRQRRFFLQAGEGDGLIYHNGQLVFAHEELFPYDRIQLGISELIFVPLCGERFAWEEV